MQSLPNASTSQANFNFGDITNQSFLVSNVFTSGGVNGASVFFGVNKMYTAGAMGTNAGDGADARTGVNGPADTESALGIYDNRPNYVDVVFVMRVL